MKNSILLTGSTALTLIAVFFCGSLPAQQPAAKPGLDRQALAHFLVEAKRHTYASQGDEATVTPLLPGTHQLEFTSGPFLYRDIYTGSATFAGQEIVYFNGRPVWSMSYAGQVHDGLDPETVKKVVALLHSALMHVTEAEPYRGPRQDRLDTLLYSNEVEGKLDNFYGTESIGSPSGTLYELRYGGGSIR